MKVKKKKTKQGTKERTGQSYRSATIMVQQDRQIKAMQQAYFKSVGDM
jgi:hypothetical protein